METAVQVGFDDVIEQVASVLFDILVVQELNEDDIVGDWIGTSPHGLHGSEHEEEWQDEFDAFLSVVDENYFGEQAEL